MSSLRFIAGNTASNIAVKRACLAWEYYRLANKSLNHFNIHNSTPLSNAMSSPNASNRTAFLGSPLVSLNRTHCSCYQSTTSRVTFRKISVAKCSNISDANVPRRDALRFLGLLATSSLVNFIRPEPTRADRTGKYSTKLTAKRRYLPRIGKGLRALHDANPQNAKDWSSVITAFDERRSDFLSALKLFGTSYFAEGNRIGATEKALKHYVDDLSAASENLVRAANVGDLLAAKDAYFAAKKAAEQYITTAKLEEIAPDIVSDWVVSP